MKKFFSILLTLFLPLSFTNVSKAAGHMEAEVIHWWTSGGEQAAISQFAEAWQEMGNTWIDTAITGGCLLYTSPSPRDGLLSRMPSSA